MMRIDMKSSMFAVLGAFAMLFGGVAFADDSFTFATWNIGHYSLGKVAEPVLATDEAPAMIARYQELIARSGASVIGLCEYEDQVDVDGTYPSATSVFAGFTGSAKATHGGSIRNAIYWKNADFFAEAAVDFSQCSQSRFYRKAYLRICGRKVCFVETHLDWNHSLAGHERDRYEQIAQLIADLRHEPYVVIGGDFNTCVVNAQGGYDDSPSDYEPFRTAGFAAAHWGTVRTWPASGPYQTIDNVFARGFAVSEVEALGDPELSDHNMLKCRLTFLPEREAAIAAADYFADPTRPDDSGDGKTPATAKRTAQAAIDLAKDGEAVLLLPGVYKEGGDPTSAECARIVVSNAVSVRGLPGRRLDTVILGQKASTDNGLGEGALRCAYLSKAGASLEGLTLSGGSTATNGYGGGVYSTLYTVYVYDCAIRGCQANRAGAAYRTTMARCLVMDCVGIGSGNIFQQTRSAHCVFTHNKLAAGASNPLFLYCGAFVNNTVYDNSGYVFGSANSRFLVYNSIFTANSGVLVDSGKNGYAGFTNCVTDVAASTFRDEGGSVAGAEAKQAFAPALDDWRVKADSPAIQLGDAANVTMVSLPDRFKNTDYSGAAVPTDGRVTAGAVQEVAPASVGGTLTLNGDFVMKGRDYTLPGYMCFTVWPTQVVLTAKLEEGEELFGLKASGAATNTRFPDMDGWFQPMPPPAGKNLTLAPLKATAVLCVDPNGGEGVYTTLQDAVDAAATGDKANTVIHVAAGRYATGGATLYGHKARVAIDNRRVRLVGAGTDKSFIVGEGDSTSEDGTGANAVRCGAANCTSAVQGFTLVGGCSGSAAADLAYYGGGFYGSVNSSVVLDCDFNCCTGQWYATAYCGDYVRCRFTGCRSVGGGQFSYARLISSLTYGSVDNPTGSAGQAIVNTSAQSYFSTFIGSDDTKLTRQNSLCYGSIFDTAVSYYHDDNYGVFIGNLQNNCGSSSGVIGALFITADPKFADVGARDYHIASDSPAIGPFDDARILEAAWPYVTSDLDGNLMTFTDGKPTLGCYQVPATTLKVTVAGGGKVTINGQKVSTIVLSPGQQAEVRPVLDRPFSGFVVDGEALDPSVTNYVYTAAAGDRLVSVTAMFGTDWYVDATYGNDAHSGALRTDAKRTLAAAFACNLLDGDTVNALPGVYSNGTMKAEGEELASRVIVPAKRSLVAVGSAEETVILGEPDSTVENGLGPKAVRCADVANGGLLRGFTLTGGHTGSNAMTAGNDKCGSAVLGHSWGASAVEDCIVSNNAAYNSTGYQCGFRRCLIVGNSTTYLGAAGQNSGFSNCLINGNTGDNQISYAYAVENTTIGPDISPANANSLSMVRAKIKNTLVLGGRYSYCKGAKNCALVKGSLETPNEEFEDCIITNAAALAVDENFVPVVGRSAVVDRGDLSLVDVGRSGTADFAGNPRVMNGAMDIGCFEADWKPVYSKILGRGVTVTAASSNVVAEVGGKSVKVPAGQTLALDWTRDLKGEAREFRYRTAVTGEGALSITVDGGEPKAVTAADDPQQSFRSADGSHALTFAFDEGAEGYAELSKFTVPFGLLLMVR